MDSSVDLRHTHDRTSPLGCLAPSNQQPREAHSCEGNPQGNSTCCEARALRSGDLGRCCCCFLVFRNDAPQSSAAGAAWSWGPAVCMPFS